MDWNQFLKEKVKTDIKRLYLQHIYLLEDYLSENRISENEFQRARKRVLDSNNDFLRSFDAQIDEFEITLKKKQ